MHSRFIVWLALVVVFLMAGVPSADAEKASGVTEPVLPAPIESLRSGGAQMKYLGRDLGYDGWIAVKDGQEQYFYVTPDGSAFFLGVLFNKNGRAVTFDQIKRLQGKKDPIFNDLMNAPAQTSAQALAEGAAVSEPETAQPTPASTSSPSLSEQLMIDVQGGSYFTVGSSKAPILYIFVDPLCPHCKEMLKVLKPAVVGQKLQLKVLLIGALHPESLPLATGILAGNDPAAMMWDLVEKGPNSLKLGSNQPDQRLDHNLAILQKWKFEGTPVSVYRGRDGKVKLIQGAAANADILLKDLP